LLCRTYYDDTDDFTLAQHAPWLSFFINKKREALSEEDLFKNSLEIAVRLAETEKFEEYFSGFSAFEFWINEIEKYASKSSPQKFDVHEIQSILLIYLMDSRRSACNYITEMNNSYRINEADKIIDNYRNEVKLLEDLHQNVIPPYNSKPEDWTKEILNKQIDSLHKVLDLEKQSIQKIKELL
jgi:hypothetical protein